MEKKHLRQFSEGENFTAIAVIQKIELKRKKDGHSYLNLFVSDAGGRVPAKIWQNAEKLHDELRPQMIVKISGAVHQYNERRELHIENIRLAKKNERDLSLLIPSSAKDPEPLIKNVTAHISAIADEYLILLLRKIFPNKKALHEFLKAPSGKLWHHNYLYGTLESVSALLDLAETMKIHYPGIELHLLKCALILRALGRQRGIEPENYIEYSSERRLLGYAYLCGFTIGQTIHEIENFPETLRLRLLHLILFDEENEASAIKPMTLEAIVLHHLEKLDMQTNATQRIIENDLTPGGEWTRFNNLLNRFVYVGHKANDNETDKNNK